MSDLEAELSLFLQPFMECLGHKKHHLNHYYLGVTALR